MRKYFYTDGISKFGPFSKEELKSQNITRSSKVWYFGISNWIEISKVPELEDVVLSIPPEIIVHHPLIKTQKEKSYAKESNGIRNSIAKLRLSNRGVFFILLGSIFVSLGSIGIYKLNKNYNIHSEIADNSFEGEELKMYYDKFCRDLEFFGIFPVKPQTIIIKFSKLDELENTTHIHGMSFGYNDDSKIEIYINPSSWKKLSKPMRYMVMYHELAHDVLNLDDLENNQENQGKLMFPEVSSYKEKNMDDFIECYQELFEEQTRSN